MLLDATMSSCSCFFFSQVKVLLCFVVCRHLRSYKAAWRWLSVCFVVFFCFVCFHKKRKDIFKSPREDSTCLANPQLHNAILVGAAPFSRQQPTLIVGIYFCHFWRGVRGWGSQKNTLFFYSFVFFFLLVFCFLSHQMFWQWNNNPRRGLGTFNLREYCLSFLQPKVFFWGFFFLYNFLPL